LNQIHERLEELARNIFDDDSLVLTDSTSAADIPGWDSLGHVNFMFSIENEFSVQFTEDEFIGFEDIGELKRVLADKVAPR
jgi:acyl carrier protein